MKMLAKDAKLTLTWQQIIDLATPTLKPLLQPFAEYLLTLGVQEVESLIALFAQDTDEAIAQIYAALAEDALTAQILADGAALDGAAVDNAAAMAAQKAWLTAFATDLEAVAKAIAASVIAGICA